MGVASQHKKMTIKRFIKSRNKSPSSSASGSPLLDMGLFVKKEGFAIISKLGRRREMDDPPVVEVDSPREVSPTEITLSDIDQQQTKKTLKRNTLKTLNLSACCDVCLKTLFVLFGIVAVILAISMITITVLTSIATKPYDKEQSSRLVAMVLLTVTAAIAVCVVIYAEVAVFKKQTKPVHSAALVLFVLALLQALIASISVNMTESDELNLGKSLAESFRLSKENNPRHVKLWSMTQNDLNCCGVYGPEDYRSGNLPYYFPPNVPISCCPTYDSSRSDLVQEKEREACKARKSYYDVGCKELVVTVFKETSAMVMGVTIAMIITEIFLMIMGGFICKRTKQKVEDKKLEK